MAPSIKKELLIWLIQGEGGGWEREGPEGWRSGAGSLGLMGSDEPDMANPGLDWRGKERGWKGKRGRESQRAGDLGLEA